MKYLIDTNIVSELITLNPEKKVVQWFDAVSDEGLYLSVLTLGEIRKGTEKLQNTEKKEKLRIWLASELPDLLIFPDWK